MAKSFDELVKRTTTKKTRENASGGRSVHCSPEKSVTMSEPSWQLLRLTGQGESTDV